MPLAPPRSQIPPAARAAAAGEVTLRHIQEATGKTYTALAGRARREGWPSRPDPRLDGGNRNGTRRLYRVADIPADLRAPVESRLAARGHAAPAPPHGVRIPPRKRRKFLELGT